MKQKVKSCLVWAGLTQTCGGHFEIRNSFWDIACMGSCLL